MIYVLVCYVGRFLPCPGISEPESLTPASRLIIDSVRSPKTDPKKLINPKAMELRIQIK